MLEHVNINAHTKINFIRSEGKEIQKHLIKIGPFTLLLVFAGQNILYTYVHNSD